MFVSNPNIYLSISSALWGTVFVGRTTAPFIDKFPFNLSFIWRNNFGQKKSTAVLSHARTLILSPLIFANSKYFITRNNTVQKLSRSVQIRSATRIENGRRLTEGVVRVHDQEGPGPRFIRNCKVGCTSKNWSDSKSKLTGFSIPRQDLTRYSTGCY